VAEERRPDIVGVSAHISSILLTQLDSQLRLNLQLEKKLDRERQRHRQAPDTDTQIHRNWQTDGQTDRQSWPKKGTTRIHTIEHMMLSTNRLTDRLTVCCYQRQF